MSGLKRAGQICSEEAASAYLAGLINVEKERNAPYSRFGLEPIRRLMERLGDPQADLSVIHLAGSKGKGSTGLMAEALLGAAGERVGTFTSPHLERWSERFRIDGREVTGELLAEAVERIAPHIDALREEDPRRAPSFFDALTAIALLLFSEAKVDRCVFEVGLGGRLDSTNVITAAVSCITNIEFEHTQQLGNTLAEIASEKAGILKSGVPAVIGDLRDEAAEVVEARARELGAPLAWLGRDFDFEVLDRDLEGQSIRLTDGSLRVDARIAALGSHQARNAALALACVARAPGVVQGEPLIEAAERGFAAARLPGRVELIGRAPWLLVDSAHTGASAAALAAVLRRIPRRRSHLVLSISAGKDADAILRHLLPEVNAVTVTRAEPVRSLSPADVATAIRAAAPGVSVQVVPNPHLALRAAREEIGAEDLLCVSGSIYLAGIARRVFCDAGSNERVAGSRCSGDG
ncbi:MAG: bifunctional folylpolyglutamate synthase/dihydrofolate synthase [Myxococcales bacterium]|nr:bifunctional folylpolyglutamate synthase/dihydrofolate synthase [Myxococcales bacterium]